MHIFSVPPIINDQNILETYRLLSIIDRKYQRKVKKLHFTIFQGMNMKQGAVNFNFNIYMSGSGGSPLTSATPSYCLPPKNPQA